MTPIEVLLSFIQLRISIVEGQLLTNLQPIQDFIYPGLFTTTLFWRRTSSMEAVWTLFPLCFKYNGVLVIKWDLVSNIANSILVILDKASTILFKEDFKFFNSIKGITSCSMTNMSSKLTSMTKLIILYHKISKKSDNYFKSQGK